MDSRNPNCQRVKPNHKKQFLFSQGVMIMINPVPPEILQKEKAINPSNMTTQQPLVFQFYYGQSGKADLINTIYLEDGNEASKLHLEVLNVSKNIIVLSPVLNSPPEKLATVAQGGANAASPERCHFQLRWQKDLGLNPSEITIQGKSISIRLDKRLSAQPSYSYYPWPPVYFFVPDYVGKWIPG
jgi:hypothetical protein